MKKSAKLTMLVIMTIILCALLAIVVSAETYTVKYSDINGGNINSKNNGTTDENGKITLRDTSVTTNADKVFYGWFASDGTFYTPGQEITVTENITLREAYAYLIKNEDDLKTYLKSAYRSCLLRLDADLNVTSPTGLPGWEAWNGTTTIYLDLNGHTITATGNGGSNNALFDSTRMQMQFLNSADENGKVIANELRPTDGIYKYNKHGSGDSQSYGIYVGKNVYIETTGSLFRISNDYNSTGSGAGNTCPHVKIWGTVVAYSIVNAEKKATYLSNIDIYSGADVTLTGPTWWTNPRQNYAVNFADVMIEDGAKITTTSEDFQWIPTIEYLKYVKYDITGGSFNAVPQDGFLKNGYQCVYNSQTGRYDVEYVGCTLEGSDGAHSFVAKESYEGATSTCTGVGVYYFRCECGDYYVDAREAVGHEYSVLVSETPATCTAKGYKTYKCVRCDATQSVEYGSALGHDYTNVEVVTPATSSVTGVKRYTCVRCSDSYEENYTLDPAELPIMLTVKLGDGTTKEISVILKNAYKLTYSGSEVAFDGVLDSIVVSENEIYTKADIVKLTIPVGITSISKGAFDSYTVLEEVVLADGTNVTFQSEAFKSCPALTTLTLGEGTYVFKEYTVSTTKKLDPDATTCPLFSTIDMRKANVTFEANAFRCNTSIKHILMSSGHTYSYGTSAFHEAGLTELIFPDNSTISWGNTSFAEGQSLEYIYFGSNIGVKQVTDSAATFDGVSNLKKVIVMDLTYFGQWAFSTKEPNKEFGPLQDLYIYVHSSSISFNNKALNNRKGNYKVYIYSIKSIGNNFENCNYIVTTGIPHAYTENDLEPTCTVAGSTGYSTDCPCGQIQNADFSVRTNTTYTGDTTGTITIGEVKAPTGHEFLEQEEYIVSQTSAYCGTNATITYKCKSCDETKTVEQEGTAIEHNLDEWTTVIPVTCTTDGTEQQSCLACSKVVNARTVSAKGHDIEGVEWTQSVAPTCILEGTEVKLCKTCSAAAESQPVSANGHTPGEFTIALEPDCDDNGIKEQKCTVCNALIATEAIEKLGHDYDLKNGATVIGLTYPNGFTAKGNYLIRCSECSISEGFESAPLFTAKGYSTNTAGTALNAGYTVDVDLLEDYEKFNGELIYGVIIANAESFGENGFFTEENRVNSEKAIQAQIDQKAYSNFDCSLGGFGANSGTLKLIITAYVIDADGNVSFFQAVNDYAVEVEIGGSTFTSVTLDLVREALLPESPATQPSDEEE